MTYISPADLSRIQQWVLNKADLQTITQELTSMGYDEHSISHYLKEFKRVKYAKRNVKGFAFLGIGASLGFVACVLCMINPVPELYSLILYGLTSAAVAMLIAGLYYLLEA